MFTFCQFGAGRIGAIHAESLSRNENARIGHVVDINTEAAAALAAKYGAAVSDEVTALGDPEVAAVVIASSTNTHADLIQQSARASKAVFCEKPIDLNLERAEESAKVVRDCGVPAMLGFNRRFDRNIAGLKASVDEGAIGDLETLIITSRDPAPPPLDYIRVSGGLFRDMMIHDLDMACWLLGETPAEIFVHASNLVDPAIGDAGDVDTAAVSMRTAGGVLCHITNSRRATYGYDQRIEAFASKGMLQVGNVTETTVVASTEAGVGSSKPLHFFLERYADAYRAELGHFVDCLGNGEAPSVSLEDGVRALRLADAANESMESGTPVWL